MVLIIVFIKTTFFCVAKTLSTLDSLNWGLNPSIQFSTIVVQNFRSAKKHVHQSLFHNSMNSLEYSLLLSMTLLCISLKCMDLVKRFVLVT